MIKNTVETQVVQHFISYISVEILSAMSIFYIINAYLY